ncbi:MAG: membrane protein insertase YidC [Propionibacteriaceae bacterium]|nr:membrane protein insertase YidC [Propionibacteriaceae bacterium]
MIAMASLAQIGDWIMTPFYWIVSSVLIFFHWLLTPVLGTGNAAQGWVWFLSLILMTCVIRGATLPLYAKQLNSQRAMSGLQGKMKELQKKYAGDRQRQSAETMKLYQEAGVSPYASCLPMLAQMPVLLSVFWVIRGVAVETSAKRGMFTLDSMAPLKPQFENATFFGARLSQAFMPMNETTLGTKVLIVIMVLLMMLTLFYQQWYMMKRNMPPAMLEGAMGQQQKMMLYVMPFMYLISGAAVPVGVLIYWLMSNVWTMAQQYFMVRVYPTPDTPAYAAWEDRMYAMGKDPVEIEKARREKARTKNGGRLTAKMAEMAQTAQEQSAGAKPGSAKAGAGKPAITQTVTTTVGASGKQVVVRQQPHNVSRAKRKH